MSQLTITLDTEDAKVIKAVSGMLTGLMDGGEEIATTNEVKYEEHVAELDSEGMPWDARIHSSAKSKTQDGKWKLARNVDKALVEAVKAEYIDEGNDDSTPSETTESIVMPKEEATEADVPPPPPAEPEATPPPPPATGSITELTQLLPAIRAAKLDPKTVVEVCNAVGVKAVVELNMPNNKHLIPDVAMMLGL